MFSELTAEQKNLVERVYAIAKERMAPRAAGYDKDASFPVEDIQDLHREGLLLATLSEDKGGLGYGFHGRDPLAFFLIIEQLARVNPATAHCFQVHCNSLQLTEYFGEDDILAKVVEATRERGKLIPAAGSEPSPIPKSEARPVAGGYLVNGLKHYVTNATYAEWIWLGVILGDDYTQFAVPVTSPGIEIDEKFWDPVGMRACVSPLVNFKDCFVPDEYQLRRGKGFRGERWLAKINLGFTTNYLGALQGMYDWLLGYISQRGRTGEQVYQVAIGEIKTRIDATRLLLYSAIALTRTDEMAGLIRANEAKWLAVDTIGRTIVLGGQMAGSTALFNKYPYQRLVRDMHVHSLHVRNHVGAQLVARHELGLPYDINATSSIQAGEV